MRVADIMTRGVVSATAEMPLTEAIDLMVEREVSGVPVLDQTGAVIGMLTEGDLLRRAELETAGRRGWFDSIFGDSGAADYVRTHGRRVRDVMTSDPATIAYTAPLSEAVALMERRGFKRLPIVKDGVIAGILSRADLVRELAKRLRGEDDSARDMDRKIRKQIAEELVRQKWAPREIKFEVADRVVRLHGIIDSTDHRNALRVLCENVPGVVRVEDQLTLLPPSYFTF
jgi:CBS domain-containing protein